MTESYTLEEQLIQEEAEDRASYYMSATYVTKHGYPYHGGYACLTMEDIRCIIRNEESL